MATLTKTQIFAENRRFSQIRPFSWKFKHLEGAGNRRKPQIFAENRRKPQIGLRHLRSVTFSSALPEIVRFVQKKKTRDGCNCPFHKTPRAEGGDKVQAVSTQGSRQVCLSRGETRALYVLSISLVEQVVHCEFPALIFLPQSVHLMSQILAFLKKCVHFPGKLVPHQHNYGSF